MDILFHAAWKSLYHHMTEKDWDGEIPIDPLNLIIPTMQPIQNSKPHFQFCISKYFFCLSSNKYCYIKVLFDNKIAHLKIKINKKINKNLKIK